VKQEVVLSCGAAADDIHLAGLNGLNTPGVAYGASWWPGASYEHPTSTKEHPRSTLYFLMSTFNPYHVVLMRTVIGVASKAPPTT
jgi:hypothetical protein